jgi:hypothetical protein
MLVQESDLQYFATESQHLVAHAAAPSVYTESNDSTRPPAGDLAPASGASDSTALAVVDVSAPGSRVVVAHPGPGRLACRNQTQLVVLSLTLARQPATTQEIPPVPDLTGVLMRDDVDRGQFIQRSINVATAQAAGPTTVGTINNNNGPVNHFNAPTTIHQPSGPLSLSEAYAHGAADAYARVLMSPMQPTTSYGDGCQVQNGCTTNVTEHHHYHAASQDAETASMIDALGKKFDSGFKELKKDFRELWGRFDKLASEVKHNAENHENARRKCRTDVKERHSSIRHRLRDRRRLSYGGEESLPAVETIDNRLAEPQSREAELRGRYDYLFKQTNGPWIELPKNEKIVEGDRVIVKAVTRQDEAYIGKIGTHVGGNSGLVSGFPDGLPDQQFKRDLLRIVLFRID